MGGSIPQSKTGRFYQFGVLQADGTRPVAYTEYAQDFREMMRWFDNEATDEQKAKLNEVIEFASSQP
jgi:hypothetical protein